MKLRSLKNNDNAIIGFIMMGILILVMSVMAINIVYPILGATDISGIDTSLRTKFGESAGFAPVKNATVQVINGANTVMGINPLAALVAVAAGILTLLMAAFTPGKQGGGI